MFKFEGDISENDENLCRNDDNNINNNDKYDTIIVLDDFRLHNHLQKIFSGLFPNALAEKGYYKSLLPESHRHEPIRLVVYYLILTLKKIKNPSYSQLCLFYQFIYKWLHQLGHLYQDYPEFYTDIQRRVRSIIQILKNLKNNEFNNRKCDNNVGEVQVEEKPQTNIVLFLGFFLLFKLKILNYWDVNWLGLLNDRVQFFNFDQSGDPLVLSAQNLLEKIEDLEVLNSKCRACDCNTMIDDMYVQFNNYEEADEVSKRIISNQSSLYNVQHAILNNHMSGNNINSNNPHNNEKHNNIATPNLSHPNEKNTQNNALQTDNNNTPLIRSPPNNQSNNFVSLIPISGSQITDDNTLLSPNSTSGVSPKAQSASPKPLYINDKSPSIADSVVRRQSIVNNENNANKNEQLKNPSPYNQNNPTRLDTLSIPNIVMKNNIGGNNHNRMSINTPINYHHPNQTLSSQQHNINNNTSSSYDRASLSGNIGEATFNHNNSNVNNINNYNEPIIPTILRHDSPKTNLDDRTKIPNEFLIPTLPTLPPTQSAVTSVYQDILNSTQRGNTYDIVSNTIPSSTTNSNSSQIPSINLNSLHNDQTENDHAVAMAIKENLQTLNRSSNSSPSSAKQVSSSDIRRTSMNASGKTARGPQKYKWTEIQVVELINAINLKGEGNYSLIYREANAHL